MKATLVASALLLAVWFLLTSPKAKAQGVGSSADLTGTVTDPSGGGVPDAKVTAIDEAKGIQRNAVTDDHGSYRVSGLPPSTYKVTVDRAGFATEIVRNVVLTVGQTVVLDVHLKLAGTSATVEVTSEPLAVETQRGSQADTLTQTYIMDLPIDRRDYLTFTLLAPGVSNSDTIASNADFRPKQTPQSGLSFYGSNGRGNSVSVDGGEANDDAGGVRLTLSQDAVQEFQINRSNYAAEFGGASGATINIISKSGSNDVHATLFGYFRNDGMDARDRFAYSQALQPGDPFSLDAMGEPIKNSLNRQQFGGSIGFPIHKDKTFLFLAYEGLREDSEQAVPLLLNSSIFGLNSNQQGIVGALEALPGNPNVPCITTNPANPFAAPAPLPAQTCAFFLSSLLNINPNSIPNNVPGGNPFISPIQAGLNQYIVNQFETQGGLFPFPTRESEFSGRLDHRLSDTDQFVVRYNFSHLTEKSPDVQALTAYNRGTSELAWDSTALGSWFHQFSPNTSNEASFQWNWYQFNVETNEPGGPGLDVEGYGFFSRSIFLPSYTTGRRYEISDNFTKVVGHHTLKMGFEELIRGNNTTSQTFFPGRFEFLELPGFLLSPCLTAPAFCGLSASQPAATVSTLQAWGLGLPAFYEQGFGNPKYVQTRPFTAFYGQDSWTVRPGLTLNYGLRYELDSQYGPLHTPKTNFGPRVSFAWDPFHDQKTVIRGGYGIFYSQIYAQIPGVVAVLGNNNGTRTIANSLVTINGFPGNPVDCTPGVNCVTNPVASSAAIFQTLFGTGVFPCTPPAGQFACITPTDLAPFGLEVANTGPLPPGTVLFSGQPNYKSPTAQQVSFGIDRALPGGFSFSANYVYVHTTHLPVALDSNLLPGAPICPSAGVVACGAEPTLGANGLPTNGLPFQNWGAPACIADPGLCFADPTHTILQNNVYSSAASALYQGGIFELKRSFANHFTLLVNYTYSRATDDATDFNSDYSPFNATCLRCDRSLSDFDQRNKVVIAGVIESPWESSRILKDFQLSPIFTYNSGHPFNLLAGADINGDGHFTNDRPPGDGRNTGVGPAYTNFDLRLSRSFKTSEKTNLLFTAEAFNLANHTNYATVNNIVGSAFAPPFSVHGTDTVGPSQPLGFTSAFPNREVQLGVRFTF